MQLEKFGRWDGAPKIPRFAAGGPRALAFAALTLCLGWTGAALASPSYDSDAATTLYSAGTTPATMSFPLGSGNNQVLFVAIQYENTAVTSNTVSFNAVAMTYLTATTVNTATGINTLWLYYLAAPAAGT